MTESSRDDDHDVDILDGVETEDANIDAEVLEVLPSQSRDVPVISVTGGSSLSVGGSMSIVEGRGGQPAGPALDDYENRSSEVTIVGNTKIHGNVEIVGKLDEATLALIVKQVICELRGLDDEDLDEEIEKKIEEIARRISGDGTRKIELEE